MRTKITIATLDDNDRLLLSQLGRIQRNDGRVVRIFGILLLILAIVHGYFTFHEYIARGRQSGGEILLFCILLLLGLVFTMISGRFSKMRDKARLALEKGQKLIVQDELKNVALSAQGGLLYTFQDASYHVLVPIFNGTWSIPRFIKADISHRGKILLHLVEYEPGVFLRLQVSYEEPVIHQYADMTKKDMPPQAKAAVIIPAAIAGILLAVFLLVALITYMPGKYPWELTWIFSPMVLGFGVLSLVNYYRNFSRYKTKKITSGRISEILQAYVRTGRYNSLVTWYMIGSKLVQADSKEKLYAGYEITLYSAERAGKPALPIRIEKKGNNVPII